jgi:phage shock protein A
MGVLERLSTLLRANINDMLDNAEDPEVMLNQILRDMEGEITKARSQVADMMAQERLFRDDLQAEQQKAAHMEERAETYVRQGNDAMAREALKRKSDSDANMQVLQQQLAAQSDMVNRLRSQLDALQAKYQDAMSNRDNLLARYRNAKAQQQITKSMSNLDVTDYSSDLSRMEQRIRRTEARAGAEQELNQGQGTDIGSAFDTDERNSAIDSQLAALKQRLGSGPGSEDGGATSGETRNLGSTGSH